MSERHLVFWTGEIWICFMCEWENDDDVLAMNHQLTPKEREVMAINLLQ